MSEYDVWIFGVLAEDNYRSALRQAAKDGAARRALTSRAARPSEASGRRESGRLRQLVTGFTGWLLFRRRATKAV